MKTIRLLIMVAVLASLSFSNVLALDKVKKSAAEKKINRSLKIMCLCMEMDKALCTNETVTLIVTVKVNNHQELELVDVESPNEALKKCFAKSFDKRDIKVKDCKPGRSFKIPITFMLTER